MTFSSSLLRVFPSYGFLEAGKEPGRTFFSRTRRINSCQCQPNPSTFLQMQPQGLPSGLPCSAKALPPLLQPFWQVSSSSCWDSNTLLPTLPSFCPSPNKMPFPLTLTPRSQGPRAVSEVIGLHVGRWDPGMLRGLLSLTTVCESPCSQDSRLHLCSAELVG